MPCLSLSGRGPRVGPLASTALVALTALLVAGGLVLAGLLPSPLRDAATASEPALREFTLTAEEIDWEIMSGTTVRAWAYNGQVPGPEIRVREGDRVRITLVNKLPVGTTIHWHGLNVPPDQDGPAGLNQAPVEPGETFTYDWIATPAGTRWYHAHTDVATQVMLGLYGSLIVEPKDGGEDYDRDYTYILSEWDNELTPDVATGKAPRGPRDQTLRGGELGTDLFMMNGKTHEAIPPIAVAEGDRVLIRLINAGTLAHPFHTHGHSFRIVATDGNPVPEGAQLTKDTILIAPGERYDLSFDAVNPGVWMVHCHIENHAANGMMTVIEYEGVLPSGPIAEFWNLPPSAGGAAAFVGGEAGQGAHGGHVPEGDTGSAGTPRAAGPAPGLATDDPTGVLGTTGPVAEIAMVDDRFEPKVLTVNAGTTVVWTNAGANWHSVASFDGSFESAKIAPGESFSHTFAAPGTYRFICKHHGRQGMSGQIVVAP